MNDPAVRVLRDSRPPPPLLSRPDRNCLPALLQTTAEGEYRQMERTFRASGGMATADQVVTRLLERIDQPISRLARWIVARDVLSFRWRSTTMLPMFQFDASTLSPRPAVAEAIRELVPALSDWDASFWFAQPNVWLSGVAPADAITTDPQAVFEAARAHRYLVRG